jgi:DNA-binding XRE family transcriptional regulator
MDNIELSQLVIDPKKLREARGTMKQIDVAKKIGVSFQAINNIETGRSKPSSDLLVRLCALYGVDARNLVEEKNLAA